MYKDDSARSNYADRNSEDVWSKPVRAGKRTYFFDVKTTKGSKDYFLTITESKRRQEQDGSFSFDKHKIFLYKEDFEKFQEGLSEVLAYMKENLLKDVPYHDGSEHEAESSQEKGDSDQKRFTDISFDEF